MRHTESEVLPFSPRACFGNVGVKFTEYITGKKEEKKKPERFCSKFRNWIAKIS